MADFLGLSMLIITLGIVMIIAIRYPSVAIILIVAFFARAAAALFHFYVFPLPDGVVDAVTFEQIAWDSGRHGIQAAIGKFPGIDSYTYAWLMSLFYAITDRSLLALQATSVLASVLAVFYTWRLASEIWSENSAHRAAWIAALFPMAIQYGALPLREAWVVLFLMMGLLSVARWGKTGNLNHVIVGVLLFAISSVFHGGIIIAAMAFLGLGLAQSSRLMMASSQTGSLPVKHVLNVIVGLAIILIILSGRFDLPKIGNIYETITFEFFVRVVSWQSSLENASSSYGSWQVPNSPIDMIWITPLKFIHFFCAPFIWDIRELKYVVGLIDGTAYLFILYVMWSRRREILQNPSAKAVFIVLIVCIFVFSLGTGNFGTGIRHRAKFIFALIVLISPFIPQIRLLSPSLKGFLSKRRNVK